MPWTKVTDPADLQDAYRVVLGDVMSAVAASTSARRGLEHRAGVLERQYKAATQKRAQAESELTEAQAQLQAAEKEIAGFREQVAAEAYLQADLDSANSLVTALRAELQESDRLRAKTQELYDRAKIERGEQSTKVVELQQALKELRETQPSTPADVSQVEKQLTATIGKLRAAEETAREAQKRTAEVEKELAETREANLALSEQAARVADLEKALADAQTTTPAGSVDLSAVRRYVEVAMKHFDADDPTKTAHALAAAAQELNRLEEK